MLFLFEPRLLRGIRFLLVWFLGSCYIPSPTSIYFFPGVIQRPRKACSKHESKVPH